MKPLLVISFSFLSAIGLAQDAHVAPRVSAAPPEDALEFRGFWPGMTPDEARAHYLDRQNRSVAAWNVELAKRGLKPISADPEEWHCTTAPASRASICVVVKRSLLWTEEVFAQFLPDRLVSLTWSQSREGYASVRDGLTAKYGKPTAVAEEHFQNRMGARYTGEKLKWRRGSIVLELHEYGDNIEEFSVVLIDEPGCKKYEQLTKGKPDI